MHDMRASQGASWRKRVASGVLSVVLAGSLFPVPSAFATASDLPEPSFVLSVQDEARIDLNEAWKASFGDYSSPYTITEGGTYCLSADLKAKAALVIDAPDADVVLLLQGHKLTLDGTGKSTQKTMLPINAAKSVTIDGTVEQGSKAISQIASGGDADVWAVASNAPDCALTIRNATISLESETATQRTLSTHCVRIASGTLDMSNCKVLMKMGNQSLRSQLLVADQEPEVPSAVYATAQAKSVALENCTVLGEGVSGFGLESISDTDALGNAYAVYSLAESTEVSGGKYTAVSLKGNATCLYGSALRIVAPEDGGASDSLAVEPVVLEADAGQLASGVLSTAAGSVHIDAPISFSAGDDYEDYALAEAALRSTVANGFVFGDCANGDGPLSTVLVMDGDDVQSANGDGLVIGSFEAGLSASATQSVVASFGNALPDGACDIAADGGSVVFRLNNAKAPARIGDTYYSTVAEGVAALTQGQTLTLLKDAGAIVFNRDIGAVIDLNGHTASSLTTSGQGGGDGLVVKNGAIGPAVRAVDHASAGALALVDVSIAARANNEGAYGIYAAANSGAVSVTGASSIDVTASRTSAAASAYGYYGPRNGPALVMDGVTIHANTSAASAPVYGVFNRGPSTDIVNSQIYTTTANGTTYAVYAHGALSAASSVFDAYATGVPAAAAGIGLGASSPKCSEARIDSCAITVRSAAPAEQLAASNMACILGSTNELTGTELPSGALTLAGRVLLKSASGLHFGMNAGTVVLADDFALAAGSDTALSVSQAKKNGNVGFTVGEGATDVQMAVFAGLFSARAGSYYDGWKLVADTAAHTLVWHPAADDGAGVVAVLAGGSGAPVLYRTLAEALAAAKSGDTVKLLADLSETGAQTIGVNDLVIDLGGHTLTLVGGTAPSVLKYTGKGTLSVAGGVLDVRAGKPTETTAATYEGIAVSGGGTLKIARDATVRAAYAGAAATLTQYAIAMRGISVASGALALEGKLEVKGARADGAVGAMAAYGVYAQPGADSEVKVDVARGASVSVDGLTAATSAANAYYAEVSNTIQAGPEGLREITVDPVLDAELYNDIVQQFRISASYDDPTGSHGSQRTHSAGIYYAQNMVLDHDGAWYDGLRIWAFTDVVPESKVGKLDSLVPTQIFISTYCDTLPNAYGIVTGASSKGAATVSVKGAVSAASGHGNAYALYAQEGDGGTVSWSCAGASLSAAADKTVHPVAQKEFDLRDFIEFTPKQEERVMYSLGNVSYARFTSPTARCIFSDGKADVVLSGAVALGADALDVAAIEAGSIAVDASFALASGSDVCTVANPAGANEAGQVFAVPTAGAALSAAKASLFADAYGACEAGLQNGKLAWIGEAGCSVAFKVGDAVVARYAGNAPIDLAEPSAAAARVDDQRQSYTLLGWSLEPDENAVSGYLAPDARIAPTQDAVYYAVYGTDLTTVPVVFTNVFDSTGACQNDLTVPAVYGQTVGEALAAAGKELPQPADYTDAATGLTYRFVGWYPYSSTVPASALLYDDGKLAGLEASLLVNGVSSGALTMRATYLAVEPGQHVVTFVSDGYASVCAVDDGERPVYTSANNTNASYISPSKQDAEAGKTFTFSSWYVDADGNGKLDEGEKSYPGILPRAYDDVTYTADWSWKWSDVTFTFYIKYYNAAAGTLDNNGVRVIDTTYEKATQDIADSVVKIGDTFSFGGRIYTFEGWAVRATDSEAIYNDDNRLPSVSGDDRMLTTSYAKTYYGIYKAEDRKVAVTFMDRGTKVGEASVASTRTVAQAFSATGAAQPKDISAEKQFLGWAKDASAASALDAVSTKVEDLADASVSAITLHAVYGIPPVYRVRLRNDDGSKTLYNITVRKGSTVNEVLAAAGQSVSIPVKAGSYFAGWYTAGGAYVSLDDPVTGALDLFRTYRPITVSTADSSDITAAGTSTSKLLENTQAVSITLAPRTSADTPLRSTTASKGYTILKSYDLRLVATASDGTESAVAGEVGTMSLKVYVGTRYKKSKVHAFWIGQKNGSESVLNSAEKEVDASGYISLNIDNYLIGDQDEGGNLSIAYKEGGKSGGSLDGGGKSGGLSKNDDESGTGSDGKSGGLDGAAGDGEGGSSLKPSGSSGLAGLSSGSLSSGSLSSGLASGGSLAKASTSGLAKSADDEEDAENAEKAAAEKAAAEKAKAAAAGDEAAEEEAAEAAAAPINGDLVLLVIVFALIAAIVAWLLWHLLAARRRRKNEDAEIELPSLAERYAQGLPF